MTFATDIDLLHWEPNILTDASGVAQTLLSGTATLAGTTLTIPAGSFLDANISNEHVVVLGDPIAGSFPVVSVTDATTLTLSVLYDDLFPDSGSGTPYSRGSGAGITFSIRTFWPQRRIVSELLLQAAGIEQTQMSQLLNPSSLRRPCVLGTLQMIYTALAAASAEPANLLVRADLYERLYRRALRSVAVELDLDGDGEADARRMLNVLELHRT